MAAALLALLAGALTMLSPCILPILPVIAFGAASEHRHGALALLGGLVAGFTAIGLLVSGALWALEISDDSVRAVSALLLLFFGVLLLSSFAHERFAAASATASGPLAGLVARFTPTGLKGQFVLGAMLGAAWVPCSGPTLGAAIVLAANRETLLQSGAIMMAFAIGATLPMLAIAYASRQALKSRKAALADFARRANPILGAILLAWGGGIWFGADRTIQAALVEVMPEWLLDLTTSF